MSVAGGLIGVGTGLVGSLAGSIFTLIKDRQNNKHEIALIEAKIRETQAEAALQIQRIQVEGDIAMDIAAQKGFDLSQTYGNQRALDSGAIDRLFEFTWGRPFGVFLVMLFGMGDVFRVWIRPSITITLMFIMSYITFQHVALMGQYDGVVTQDMLIQIYDNLWYLTCSTIGWWFGDRTIGKRFDNKIGRKA